MPRRDPPSFNRSAAELLSSHPQVSLDDLLQARDQLSHRKAPIYVKLLADINARIVKKRAQLAKSKAQAEKMRSTWSARIDRKRDMIEAKFSKNVRIALNKCGVPSIKTNDRVTRGIPDIYFPPGSWVESKIVPGSPRPSNSPIKYFSSNQRSFLNRHTALGDNCFVAFGWRMNPNETMFVFMPWDNFQSIRFWDTGIALHFGRLMRFGRWEDCGIDRFFTGPKLDLGKFFNPAWDRWIAENPRSVQEGRTFTTLDDLIKQHGREDGDEFVDDSGDAVEHIPQDGRKYVTVDAVIEQKRREG